MYFLPVRGGSRDFVASHRPFISSRDKSSRVVNMYGMYDLNALQGTLEGRCGSFFLLSTRTS